MRVRMAFPSPLAKVQFALPWNHRAVAWIDINGHKFCILWRDQNPHPYVTYEILPDGSCYHGDYVHTFDQAYRAMTRRAGLLPICQNEIAS